LHRPVPPTPPPLLYNLYTWKLNHSRTIWGKKWSVIENILGNTLRTWGTFWELDGNKKKTKNHTPSHPLHTKTQKENLSPLEPFSFGCKKNFYFQKGLLPFSCYLSFFKPLLLVFL
jgi:hypothetical protein